MSIFSHLTITKEGNKTMAAFMKLIDSLTRLSKELGTNFSVYLVGDGRRVKYRPTDPDIKLEGNVRFDEQVMLGEAKKLDKYSTGEKKTEKKSELKDTTPEEGSKEWFKDPDTTVKMLKAFAEKHKIDISYTKKSDIIAEIEDALL